jgi:NADP-dependent 3-hydroxy acid dehydrogenase YdfG
VLAARSLEKLNQLEQKISSGGREALSVTCEVGDSAQVEAMVLAAQHRFGRIDILVNNAGQVAEAGIVPENIPHELFDKRCASTCWACGIAAARWGG